MHGTPGIQDAPRNVVLYSLARWRDRSRMTWRSEVVRDCWNSARRSAIMRWQASSHAGAGVGVAGSSAAVEGRATLTVCNVTWGAAGLPSLVIQVRRRLLAMIIPGLREVMIPLRPSFHNIHQSCPSGFMSGEAAAAAELTAAPSGRRSFAHCGLAQSRQRPAHAATVSQLAGW